MSDWTSSNRNNSTTLLIKLTCRSKYSIDTENNIPEKVKDFKSKIRQADAILIATPEYNYSVPGVLKNAIDCATRPYGDNPFNEKPVAIMSASVGMLGGARAQYHLR